MGNSSCKQYCCNNQIKDKLQIMIENSDEQDKGLKTNRTPITNTSVNNINDQNKQLSINNIKNNKKN